MASAMKEKREAVRQIILNASAKSFLENGYTNTTIRQISAVAGISSGSFNSIFHTKEDVLYELVSYVLNQQFAVTGKLLAGKTEDKFLFYAAETVLQLHIVEMSEALRDVYGMAYSLPKTSAIIQETVTGKLEDIFKEHLPNLQTKDFYMLEIATGGIMRGFMTVPCNMWFSLDVKVAAFLKSVFKLYDVPDEKINEAIAFVGQFDFKKIAEETIDGIMKHLEAQEKELE